MQTWRTNPGSGLSINHRPLLNRPTSAYLHHSPNLPPLSLLLEVPKNVQAHNSSIVAIHGLNGGARKTWEHRDPPTLWLRDFLPHLLDQDGDDGLAVRVWSFGYNANTSGTPAAAGIQDFTRSLLTHLERLKAQGVSRLCGPANRPSTKFADAVSRARS